MAIKKVWIEPGCIGARHCNKICPDVFGLDDFGEAYIEDEANYEANEKGIKKSARICPVRVIKYEEE